MLPIRLVWIVLSLFPGSFAVAQESEVESCFPLTQDEMVDESTLDETILQDELVPSTTHPGENVRKMRVSYFSHLWKDGPWKGTVSITMPEEIPPELAGMMAICPTGSSNIQPGFNLEMNYFEFTALEYGIPVMGIPNVGEHFGLTEIHDLADFLNLQFVETGDPSWLGAYPSAAVRSRGITLLSKLTGNKITSVVHMGSSISAGHGYVMARFDSRLKGLVATGSIGCFRDLFPQDGSYVSSRPAVDALAAMPEAMKQVFEYHRDPSEFGGDLDCAVLLVTGVRDRFVPPLLVSRLQNVLGGESSIIQVPEYGHGCGTDRHADAFRIWIDRVLLGNEQPELLDVQVIRSGDKFHCSAVVGGEMEEPEARLWYLAVNDPLYFQSPNFSDTPNPNYTSAEWESIPMWKEGGKWIAEVPYIDPMIPHVAWFVDFQSGPPSDRKYISTRVNLWSPAQAIPAAEDSRSRCFAASIWISDRLGSYIFLIVMVLGVILVGLLSIKRRSV